MDDEIHIARSKIKGKEITKFFEHTHNFLKFIRTSSLNTYDDGFSAHSSITIKLVSTWIKEGEEELVSRLLGDGQLGRWSSSARWRPPPPRTWTVVGRPPAPVGVDDVGEKWK
jgi:hypothetical protein